MLKKQYLQVSSLVFVALIIIVFLALYDSFFVETVVSQDFVEFDNAQIEKMDINTASIKDLCEVDGIGEKTAEKIIFRRQELGSFSAFEQLDEIDGIGNSTIERIMEMFYIDN